MYGFDELMCAEKKRNIEWMGRTKCTIDVSKSRIETKEKNDRGACSPFIRMHSSVNSVHDGIHVLYIIDGREETKQQQTKKNNPKKLGQ